MLIFQNPGLIPLEGITIMGMSAKLEGSFGMFGTGIKYSVATILRGGGSIVIYRGREAHRFTTRSVSMRDKDFEIIQLDGVDMGIATNLGLNWKPWMVLREFGCNAMDEGGSFRSVDGYVNFHFLEQPECNILQDDCTTVAIDWPALDDAFKHQGKLFIEGEPIFENEKIRILPGVSSHLYYRNVRAFDLKKPSKLTYDVLAAQTLTEDRTLYGDWQVTELAAAAILEMKDREMLAEVMTCGDGFAEHDFDFAAAWGYQTKPSREFIDTAIVARERKEGRSLSASVKAVLGKHMRQVEGEQRYVGGGGSYLRPVNDAYAYAIEILQWAKVIDTEDSGPEIMVIPVAELPGDIDSMCEGGRIYIHDRVLKMNSLEIARILLPRYMELRFPGRSEAVAHLGETLLSQHPNVARYLKMVEEDAKLKAAAGEAEEALGIAGSPVAEEAPADPTPPQEAVG